MNESGFHEIVNRLKPWRGLIISLICSAYLILFVDYGRSEAPTYWEYLVFLIVMLIGSAGMILFFVDWWKRDKAGALKKIREFEELEKRKKALRR